MYVHLCCTCMCIWAMNVFVLCVYVHVCLTCMCICELFSYVYAVRVCARLCVVLVFVCVLIRCISPKLLLLREVFP